MENRSIYQDIAMRTGGDIYLGLVGPVRTGKSTFIKKFMETGIIGATLYYVTFGGNFLSSIKKCVRKDVKYYPLATAIIITIFIENIVLQIIESSATFMLFIIFFTYLYMAGGGKILEE